MTSINTRMRWLVAATAATLIAAPASAQPEKLEKARKGGGNSAGWEQIPLSGPIDVKLPDGSSRSVEPSCSGGPIADPAQQTEDNPLGLRRGNTDFSFFVRRGNPNRLLFSFDGGGACWDGLTCIGTPLGGDSVYRIEISDTPESLADQSGLLNADNPDNPYANYTQIFVPYCSGDIHWGSRDASYTFAPEGLPPINWTVHHRGTDNFLAVIDWLQSNGRSVYNVDLKRARDVTVTGLSAGGYGAILAFPYIAELTGNARLNLISDAAIGVQTESFYANTLYRAGVEDPDSADAPTWGVVKNLPGFVPGLDETLLAASADNPSNLVSSLFQTLSEYRPDARLAALTTHLDAVQVAFYALQKGELQPSQTSFHEWYTAMAETTAAAASQPNFRFFVESGTFHTFIISDEKTFEAGELGITLADWLTGMIKPGNRAWDNLTVGAPPIGG